MKEKYIKEKLDEIKEILTQYQQMQRNFGLKYNSNFSTNIEQLQKFLKKFDQLGKLSEKEITKFSKKYPNFSTELNTIIESNKKSLPPTTPKAKSNNNKSLKR